MTREHAHWRSPLATHVVKRRPDGADHRDAHAAGHRGGRADAAAAARRATDERAIYLHEIQDPGNLGTILRTLAWFGNFRCLLSPDSVDPYNSKVVRASMGAIFHVPVEFDVALLSLPERFARIACLDMSGAPVQSPEFAAFDCYLFGNEARGLPREQLAALEYPAVHDRRQRRHRVAEPGGDGQHVCLRVEPLNTPIVRATLRMLAIGYPLALLIFIVSLRFVGEKWWGTTIALYLPRAPFALPLLPLIVAIVWLGPRKLLWTQLLAFGLLLGLMGFRVAWPTPPTPGALHLRNRFLQHQWTRVGCGQDSEAVAGP